MRTGSDCGGGRSRKIGAQIFHCLIATALCGLAAMQPASAKATRHRGAAAAVTHHAPPGKSASRASHDPGEGATTLSPPTPPPDIIRGAKPTKLVVPGSLQDRRVRRVESPNPPTRNTIGIAVVPQAKSGQGEDHLGSVVPTVPPPASGVSRGSGLAVPATGKLNVPTASLSTRGKIDGATLIRPALTPSGIGGAAKTLSGINGTTIRPKR
jgi:hypothetical protein